MIKEMYYWMMYFIGKIGKSEIFGHNSYLLISMLIMFNIITVLIVASYFFNTELKELGIDKPTTQLIGVIFGICMVGFNHFYLYENRKKICEKYDKLKGGRKVAGMICFWIYVVLSCWLLFTLGPALT